METTYDMQLDTGATAAAGILGLVFMAFYLAIAVLMIVSMWKFFVKAGQPGWAAIVPIFNIYIMLQIAGKPGWWLVLMFIPIVSFIIAIIMCIGVSNSFGKGAGFAIGMVLLPVIFYPILAFSGAEYTG